MDICIKTFEIQFFNLWVQIVPYSNLDPQIKELIQDSHQPNQYSDYSFPFSGLHIYLHTCLVLSEIKNRGLIKVKNEKLQDRTWKGAQNQH